MSIFNVSNVEPSRPPQTKVNVLMKHVLNQLRYAAASAFLGILLSTTAFAQTPSQTAQQQANQSDQAITNVGKVMIGLSMQRNFLEVLGLYPKNPLLGNTMKANIFQTLATQDARLNAKSQTTDVIKALLFSSGNETIDKLSTLAPTESGNRINSIDSLLANTTLSDEQKESAQQYVTLLAGGDAPIEPIPRKLLAKKTGPMKAYLAAIASYAAVQSVGMNTFLNLIAERTQQKDLGLYAGVKTMNGQPVLNASPLQVDTYNARRRITQPSWYNHVETASSSELQRENIYLLAEMRYEMYQNRMQLERLNATLALIQLQLAHQQGKDNLQTLRQKAINSAE